jgi:hypothetical protein
MDTHPTGIIEEAPRATTKSLTKLNLNNPSSKHSSDLLIIIIIIGLKLRHQSC